MHRIRRFVCIVSFLCMVQAIMVSAETIDPDSLWYKFEDVPFNPQTMIIADDDRVWFGSETGAWVLDNGNWTQYTTENSELPSNTVQTVTFDSTGAVWFGTSQGAAKLDGDIWTVYTTENSGLATDSVKFITFDNTNGVWMSNNTTLSHFIDDGWDTYSFWESSSYTITTIAVDSENDLWVGTLSEGLWNLHGGVWMQKVAILDEEILGVSSLLTCADGTMIGAFSGNLNAYDGESWSLLTEWSASDMMAQDNEGNIWGVFNKYLQFYKDSRRATINSGDTQISDMGPLSTPYLHAIDFDSDELMWLLSDNGLCTYSGSVCGGPYIDTAEQTIWNGDDITISWITSKPCTLDIGMTFGLEWLDIAQSIDSSIGTYHFNFSTDIFDIPYDEGEVNIEIRSDALVDTNDSIPKLIFQNPQLNDMFHTYNIFERIPGSTGEIHLIEDGDGTIWAGIGYNNTNVESTIWRYDGYEFMPVDMESIDPRYTESDLRTVSSAAIDSDGDVWFACRGGLIHHNGNVWEHMLDDFQVDSIISGINGSMWAQKETGIYSIDSGDTLSVSYPWSDPVDDPGDTSSVLPPWSFPTVDYGIFASSPEGTLFSFKSGRMASFNGETWHYYDDASGTPPETTLDLIWDSSSNVRAFKGHTVYSFSENTWTEHENGLPDIYNSSLRDVALTDDGAEWFAYSSGIFKVTEGEIGYVYSYLPNSWAQFLDKISIEFLLIDSSGMIWIGGQDTIKRLDYTYLVVEEELNSPEVFILEPVYPNPFNSSTTIRYSLDATQPVILAIYSITGQKVCELVNETQHAGVHTVQWNGATMNGAKVASGIYFARLYGGEVMQVQKMLLLK